MDLIITILTTVSFCLGWRIITDKGNILYFLRKPFEQMEDNLELNEELYLKFKSPKVFYRIYKLKTKIELARPFVLCITCMASFWGVLVFISLNGFSLSLLPKLIINSVSASFIQTYIWYKWEELKSR